METGARLFVVCLAVLLVANLLWGLSAAIVITAITCTAQVAVEVIKAGAREKTLKGK